MLMIEMMMMIISIIFMIMVTIGGAGKNRGAGSCSSTEDFKLGEKLPGRIFYLCDFLEHPTEKKEIISRISNWQQCCGIRKLLQFISNFYSCCISDILT